MEPLDHAICRLIESSAHATSCPSGSSPGDLAREQLSRRRGQPAGRGHRAIHAGTAQERGLADPFDPERAIPKAASLIADLRRQFGNLGVAPPPITPDRAGRLWCAGRAGCRRRRGLRPPGDRARCRGLDRAATGRRAGGVAILRRAGPRACAGIAATISASRPCAMGGAACRQFLEGAGARRLRTPAPALCRDCRRGASDDHRTALTQRGTRRSTRFACRPAPAGSPSIVRRPVGRRQLRRDAR